MIKKLFSKDFSSILEVVNDAAQAYKGVIPEDRWNEPYMPAEELREEIQSGIRFHGLIEEDELLGVMGIQHVKDATLIRHAYVLTEHQRKGVGSRLLEHLVEQADTSKIMVGTWRAASWAVRFYQKHGFKLVRGEEKDDLLREYWDIPKRQVETSVVLKLEK